ncbi:MAG: sulfite exporter TauE/SafE family protein [Synergistaceae bacterium]|jgi:sulfite exporter TauE/SafE/copper chaperone CopZ|nr:sulfite exporter TauE/SafE family protein [Synergistaceae bacterium]
MSNFTTKNIRVDGMTCTSCESRIERKLRKTDGVTDVRASFADSSVRVTWDEDKIGLDVIASAVESLDYRVKGAEDSKDAKTRSHDGSRVDMAKTLFVAVVLYELYFLFNRFGLLDVFRSFPEAAAGMGYGMLFVIGLLTSVHCVAMCGGINLSQSLSVRDEAKTPRAGLRSLRSGLLYNAGRVASYTVIGGVVGALGSAVSVSGEARGVVQLVAGIFMVIMGLNMLNVCPWLRRLNPHMPKIFADYIHAFSKESGASRTPFYVGLLNGLMPCGPLQAMQLYAMSSGGFVGGALSMFFFSAGTVPLMLGLSVLSSVLSKKFAGRMITVGAAMVVVMGVAMFGNGMNLSGLSDAALLSSGSASGGEVARMDGGVQIVRTELSSGGYAPITVKAGTPVRWTIHAEPGTLNGCNNRIIIPEYDRMQKKLQAGDNVIEFTPSRGGVFTYTCWMGMIRGRITVLDAADAAAALDVDPGLPEGFYDELAASSSSEPFDIFSDGGDADIFAEDAEPAQPLCCTPRTDKVKSQAAEVPGNRRSAVAPRFWARASAGRNCCVNYQRGGEIK